MKHIVIAMIMILLLTSAFASAMDTIEGPKTCKQCDMDRAALARSRMLIMYVDKTNVGACSLHCEAAELQLNRIKQVGSLMVADYSTKELIDAKKAIWVVGGKKNGVIDCSGQMGFC